MTFRLLVLLVILRIKFRLLLLRWFSKKKFQELLPFSFHVNLKTHENLFLSGFSVHHGKIKSKNGFDNTESAQINHQKSINFSFESATEAKKIGKALRQEKHKIFEFIQNKDIIVDGDFTVIQDLMQLKEKLDGTSNA